MAKMQAKFKNSSRHEEVKSADRIGKKSRAKTLNFDAYNEVHSGQPLPTPPTPTPGKKVFPWVMFFSLLIHFV